MSEIEDKILGKEHTAKANAEKKDYFNAAVIWQVSKNGCGKSTFNGQMVKEMMSPEAKQKARKGNKKINDKEFIFERKN